MTRIAFVLIILSVICSGCASQKAWYEEAQAVRVSGQNETLEILNDTGAGAFSYSGTINEVVAEVNKLFRSEGVRDVSVMLDLSLAKEFSPPGQNELELLLEAESSGQVQYKNLYLLLSDIFRDYGLTTRFVDKHVVLTPQGFTHLYSNANRRFDAFTFGEGYNNFYSLISYMNLVIPDEELVVDISNCPIIAEHEIDPSKIAEMTFLDAIRIARNRLDAKVTLEDENHLVFSCSEEQ